MSGVENTDTRSNTKSSDSKHRKGFIEGFVDSVNPGYAVAGGAALWTSTSSIDKHFNDLLKVNGRLDPINEAAAQAYDKVYPSWTKNVEDRLKQKFTRQVPKNPKIHKPSFGENFHREREKNHQLSEEAALRR